MLICLPSAHSHFVHSNNDERSTARPQEAPLDPELNALFERVSSYFALLSEPTRLKILNSLCDGERSVSEIVEHTGASQPNVSRHLNLMYSRGALKRRREGAVIFYSVADETVVTLCRTVCVQVAGQAEDLTVGNNTLSRFMPKQEQGVARQEGA